MEKQGGYYRRVELPQELMCTYIAALLHEKGVRLRMLHMTDEGQQAYEQAVSELGWCDNKRWMCVAVSLLGKAGLCGEGDRAEEAMADLARHYGLGAHIENLRLEMRVDELPGDAAKTRRVRL